MSISTILPAATLKANATRGRPPGHVPRTCRRLPARRRTSLDAPARTAASSARSTTLSSRIVSSASKSPSREAARKASDLPLAVGIGVGGGKLIAWIKDADGNPIGLTQHAPCGRFQHFSFSSNGAAHAYTAKPLRESLVPRTVGYYLHTLAEMLTSEDRRPQRADKPPRAAC